MNADVDDYIDSGDADDTLGIQAAIDAVSNYTPVNYAPEVRFTAGRTYKISSTIVIPYGVRVLAHGSVIQSTIQDGSPMVQWGDATSKPWVGSWHGGTLKGSGNIGFKIERANHGVLEDVKVGNCDIGIAIDGSDPVQWEVRRCFVSGSATAGIRAHRANVLRIVGGKIHCKDEPGAVGLHVTSSASVSVDSVDISICEAGAALFERCTGVDVRALYTERCGGVPGNDQAVVTLNECYGFNFSGCRFNAANGTVTGDTSLAWGVDITDCAGGSITGSMATTCRKGFARISYSEDVTISGCTEDYFSKRPPRIERVEWEPIAYEYMPENWCSSVDVVRGVEFVGDEVQLAGGDPDSRVMLDVPCVYQAGELLRLSGELLVTDATAGNSDIVANDMPVLHAWLQNPSAATDHNKKDERTLTPLTQGLVQSFDQDWTPKHDGDTVRIHLGTRQHWPGFSCVARSLSLRKAV